MTIGIAVLCFLQDFAFVIDSNIDLALGMYNTIQETFLLLNATVLTCSVISIRRTIKANKEAFPNEGLVKVHVANSFIFALFWLSFAVLDYSLVKVEENSSSEEKLKVEKIIYVAMLIQIAMLIF